jgi:hypothetical protein
MFGVVSVFTPTNGRPATNPSSEAHAAGVTSEELLQRCHEDLPEAFRVIAQPSINEQ